MDTEILEDLGLSKAEIKTYLALFELGDSYAGPLIVKTGLQNSVVHRALNSLIEKGIISYILEGKRRSYMAADPENFHDFIEEKVEKFDRILPELKKKLAASKPESFAKVFRGKRGVKQMYFSMLNSGGSEYNTFGGGSEVTFDVMGGLWWKSFHIKRISKKLRSRQVFDESIREFGEKLGKKPYTSIRFLPGSYAQLQETVICGDHVGIAIFTENPYAVLIRDKAVADGYRKQFEALWKIAKE